MPTPAAGSELSAAMTTAPQVTLSASAAAAGPSGLFNAAGTARGCAPRRCSRSARPSPGRRCAAAPCSRSRSASRSSLELGFDAPTKGAIATGALLAGFPGMDAPAGPAPPGRRRRRR